MGIFVSHVKAGSPAEQCGLKEGSELLEVCVFLVHESQMNSLFEQSDNNMLLKSAGCVKVFARTVFIAFL